MNSEQLIIAVCQRLYQRNMLAAADGNVSLLKDNGNILMTPSGISKAFMDPEDLITLNPEGEVLAAKQGRSPSSELSMHLTVYRNCKEARAVVHAHPPTAIAWSIAYPELNELPSEAMSEVILAVGKIPIVPYARPGSSELSNAIRPYLLDHRVMILARHGALAWGESLDEALFGMERLEHAATVLSAAQYLGKITSLAPEELEALWSLRAKLGRSTR